MAVRTAVKPSLDGLHGVNLPGGRAMEPIGPYEIVEELGGGGMARVFRAIEPSLGRTVALKVLPDEVESDEELVARFRREARIVANLAHDHIVRIYHASIEGHPYYIAMEFLWGGTLKERLSKGALPLPEAFAIGESVCSALDCAHGQGVIHRDVKPANIMFTEQGRPVVTDFGIARLLEGTPLTHSDSQLGTPFYMSPEQVNRLPIDSRTDVFSLGAVLY
ncbi:MAG: serine/threonine protein kinase, partial [Armatimonadota bacterium]|nr:serine/threonine protein kinase [Armatimonadota bacterium]